SFENVAMQGWVTEKIFDWFVPGTIPIYLGAPDIRSYIPPACFIDMRRFSGDLELRDYLKCLGKSEVQRYRESGREFIASEQYSPFTRQYFTERMARIVEEDAGVSLR